MSRKEMWKKIMTMIRLEEEEIKEVFFKDNDEGGDFKGWKI